MLIVLLYLTMISVWTNNGCKIKIGLANTYLTIANETYLSNSS